MGLIFSVLTGLFSAPLSYHLIRMPDYCTAYHSKNLDFRIAFVLWQCEQDMPKKEPSLGLRIATGLFSAPLSYHLIQMPNYARAHYSGNHGFQHLFVQWQIQQFPKDQARGIAEWKAIRDKWKKQDAEAEARERLLPRRAVPRKTTDPAG